ncbi:MAG: lipoate--protein ligase family protein [Anaerolineales bacterium]|nr:lipoate--protein ligase family protein [Anaerolineales bacterium]
MNFPQTPWRLIHTPPASGAWNMALDEAILEATGQGRVPPTLRLYAWNPPCLSLGYAQPVTDVDRDALTRHGWDLVRRPTGGRAILHTDELTYSVSAPSTEPRVAGSVLESYQRLAQALLQALHLLAVPAEAEEKYALPEDANPKGPVCFEVPSNWEITVDGKKLIGSAQVRRQVGVLQHGSLPLGGDLGRITQALVFPDDIVRADAATRLLARASTVETALGRVVTWEEAAKALEAAFAQTLNLDWERGEVTEGELKRARELVAEKYGNPAWTGRI